MEDSGHGAFGTIFRREAWDDRPWSERLGLAGEEAWVGLEDLAVWPGKKGRRDQVMTSFRIFSRWIAGFHRIGLWCRRCEDISNR